MKKYILFLSCISILFYACSDELNQYSRSAISSGSVTEKDISAVRNGVYSRMQNAPGVGSYIMFDMLGGVLSAGTSTSSKDLINNTLSPLNGYISTSWNGFYHALSQVNNMLDISDYYPQSEIGQLVRGEAHYFRAYIYYNLVTRWGGVPILRKNTLDKVPRNSIEEIWTFIEEELDNALKLLGNSSSYYFVSRDAALALKARVELSRGNLPKAAQIAEELITSGRYKLDSFEKIFRKKMNTEIIFAFENNTEESSVNVSDLYYTYAHPNKGQGTYRPTQVIVDLFTDQDKRKSISIINVSGTNCINKYPSGQTGTDPLIISRIAEMYLISAEAQGRSAGVDRLNELRRKRGLNDVFPASDDAYLTAILDERRRELMGENFMYYDLIRTGRAQTELGLLPHQLVLPIPGKELQLNPNLEPNHGY